MPHIDVKMLSGRSNEEKVLLAEALLKAIQNTLSINEKWITVSIKDFNSKEWQEVFSKEIATNKDSFIQPKYDPKTLL